MLSKNLYSLSKQSLTKTVFLPKSKFPSRHDPKAELEIQEDRTFALAYLEQDLARKPYVIHDGPPFANGPIHLGHAVNKILKDIAARYAMIVGHRVEFVAGWDCHGLPIEMQVLKQMEKQEPKETNYGGSLLLSHTESPEHFRTKARQYSKSQIDLQMSSFKRMGLLTDWNKRYTTDDPSYVASQLRAFSKLFEQKLIFKDLMPVNWSLVNKNTVAEADIEYRQNHISRTAYVMFEIIGSPIALERPEQKLYSLVWTTTPWTILENQAVAFNKQETYCIVKISKPSTSEDTKHLLLSYDCLHKVEELLQRLGYQFEMKTYIPGRSLVGVRYKPLLSTLLPGNRMESTKEALPFLDADFVDGAKGTGLVHISPNYGHEDFYLIKKYKLPVHTSLVDLSGNYVPEVKELGGKNIMSDGNSDILSILDQHQALLYTEQIQHNYPYETRTKQPIITKTSQQIFLDTTRIIPRCIKALESSSFFPENRRSQFINTLKSRPNWCISRQRSWGTPIPVMYRVDDVNREKMISHPLLIEHLCRLLYKRRFMDYWWTVENTDLVPQELLDECNLPYKSDELVRGMDIFDVWSDSGLSWHTTVNSLDDAKSQADIYLEGVDQIRGWFSASSILSMALRGCLPTKRFFLHGFVLDEMGRKMSKSQGNVIDPHDLFGEYGVDPVRVWVAKNASNHNDICVRPNEFKLSINDFIVKTRSVIKYLIGSLVDHDAVGGQFDHTKLELFDQYFLDKLYRFAFNVNEHYKNYRYHQVVSEVNQFLNNEFSAIYITTIKDRLYCDELNSLRRKSCLTVLNIAYNILLRCLYPLVPHIVHEAGQHMRTSEPLNEWKDLGFEASWRNDVLHQQFETLIGIRKCLTKLMGSRFDNSKDQNSILIVNDKKLFKSLVRITNSNPDIMSELFKSSNFIPSLDEKLQEPNDDTLITHETNDRTGLNQTDRHLCLDESPEITLLKSWICERAHELRVGGVISIDGSSEIKFELAHRKSDSAKCVRCRRYSVLEHQDGNYICDRCKCILKNFEL